MDFKRDKDIGVPVRAECLPLQGLLCHGRHFVRTGEASIFPSLSVHRQLVLPASSENTGRSVAEQSSLPRLQACSAVLVGFKEAGWAQRSAKKSSATPSSKREMAPEAVETPQRALGQSSAPGKSTWHKHC